MTSPLEWARRVAALREPCLIALDVDGTLAPIVEDPSAARVPEATCERITLLARERPVALVTGRDAGSLTRVAPIVGVHRAVEHGRVVLGPGETACPPALTREQSAALAAFARRARTDWVGRGAALEEKPTSFGVHVRALVARDARGAAAILDEAANAAAALGLHPRRGRAVLEAEAFPASKDRALDVLEARVGAASTVYVGDDLTDVPAIRHAAARGIGLFVTSTERPVAPDGASGALEGPLAVAALLDAIELP